MSGAFLIALETVAGVMPSRAASSFCVMMIASFLLFYHRICSLSRREIS